MKAPTLTLEELKGFTPHIPIACSSKERKSLYSVINFAAGTITYVVEVDGKEEGRTGSLETAINAYNRF